MKTKAGKSERNSRKSVSPLHIKWCEQFGVIRSRRQHWSIKWNEVYRLSPLGWDAVVCLPCCFLLSQNSTVRKKQMLKTSFWKFKGWKPHCLCGPAPRKTEEERVLVVGMWGEAGWETCWELSWRSCPRAAGLGMFLSASTLHLVTKEGVGGWLHFGF